MYHKPTAGRKLDTTQRGILKDVVFRPGGAREGELLEFEELPDDFDTASSSPDSSVVGQEERRSLMGGHVVWGAIDC